MSDPDAERDPLEALAAEFVERQRRGESPSIAEYAERYPDLADEIHDLFPTVIAMERLKARSERSADGLASLGPIKLERLGDFRIIREIGRGGMGIVYEAEQESLGRRVAVKVLPRQALLEARHLARFKREAHVAAGLHHTNIVQVFGVGEDDGFHYYVMQFVRGIGLDRVISALASEFSTGPSGEPGQADGDTEPTEDRSGGGVVRQLLDEWASGAYWHRAARIGFQVAQALSYAHDQGALHRDIKPANLLIDERGTVWVTDFGLAKAIESTEVTQPGDITGTLRYMAPEQLDGRTDAKSDTYSLGITLYELLTLRPGYDDTERSSLIRRITQEVPVPPRRIDPRIPRDLETIVLKAMAREPADRYVSAEVMAADLQRFLEDRPIEARRAGPAERLWRWCRRNRAVAVLAGASLLLLVAIALVSAMAYVHTKSALDAESRQRAKSEAVSAVAQEALDRIFDRLGPARILRISDLPVEGESGTSIEIPGEPVLSSRTAALLEEMLLFYDRLAEQSGDDTALRQRAAQANRRVGDIRQRLGQYDQAVDAYDRALAMYNNLGGRPDTDADFSVAVAEIHNELGRLYRMTRQPDLAQESHLRALAILAPTSSGGGPSAPAERFELARTCYFLGTRAPAEPGSKPRGPKAGQRPRRPRPDRPGRRPPPPRPRPDHTAKDDPKSGDRRAYLAKAVVLLDALVQECPKNPEYRRMLALCYRDGYRDAVAHDRAAADRALDRATQILEKLSGDFPGVPDYRFDLCETYAVVDLRDPSLRQDGFERAKVRLDKALAISERLVAEHPYVLDYLASQAHILHALGTVLRKTRRLDEAERSDRKAVAAQESLAKRFPKVLSHQVWLAAFRNSLTDLLRLREKHAEARSLLERTIAGLNKLQGDNPDMWFLHALLMDSNRTLAVVLRRSGHAEKAAEATRREQEHRRLLQRGSQATESATRPAGK